MLQLIVTDIHPSSGIKYSAMCNLDLKFISCCACNKNNLFQEARFGITLDKHTSYVTDDSRHVYTALLFSYLLQFRNQLVNPGGIIFRPNSLGHFRPELRPKSDLNDSGRCVQLVFGAIFWPNIRPNVGPSVRPENRDE